MLQIFDTKLARRGHSHKERIAKGPCLFGTEWGQVPYQATRGSLMRAFMVATVLGLAAWCGLFGNQSAAHGQAGEAPVVIIAIVPADAQIWFDGAATTQTGGVRRFYSPPVGAG